MNFYEWAKIRMVHTDSSSAREHNSVNNFSCTTKQRQKKGKGNILTSYTAMFTLTIKMLFKHESRVHIPIM